MTLQGIIDICERDKNINIAIKNNDTVFVLDDYQQRIINIYAFLIDPQYNTIPTLLADDDFKQEFLERVNRKSNNGNKFLFENGDWKLKIDLHRILSIQSSVAKETTSIKITLSSAMLVGYVIEFIQEIIK